jgi:hypothetical protein
LHFGVVFLLLHDILSIDKEGVTKMDGRRTFGTYFKERRIKLGLTLRQFCEKHSMDPGNLKTRY